MRAAANFGRSAFIIRSSCSACLWAIVWILLASTATAADYKVTGKPLPLQIQLPISRCEKPGGLPRQPRHNERAIKPSVHNPRPFPRQPPRKVPVTSGGVPAPSPTNITSFRDLFRFQPALVQGPVSTGPETKPSCRDSRNVAEQVCFSKNGMEVRILAAAEASLQPAKI